MPRRIKYLVLHCTATAQDTSIVSIQKYWREKKGWKYPGYHYIIKADGEIVQLLPIEIPSNGVQGMNSVCINIAYIGGVMNGKPVDNRTDEQKLSQIQLLSKLKQAYPEAHIVGHRDIILKGNPIKACPSFDVRSWLESINFEL